MKNNSMEKNHTQLIEYISGFSLKSEQVKQAFLSVKRENFIPENLQEYAYDDNALPIGEHETISQPSTIAIMLELLSVKEGMGVLEIGSGCGYVLALLSKLVGKKGKVYGIEIDEKLVKTSQKNLEKEKIQNAKIKQSDGSAGWIKYSPFDRIIISCSCPFIPKELFNELKESGRIVAPVGDEHTQIMEIMIKDRGKPVKKTLEGTLFAFVPMKGKNGF